MPSPSWKTKTNNRRHLDQKLCGSGSVRSAPRIIIIIINKLNVGCRFVLQIVGDSWAVKRSAVCLRLRSFVAFSIRDASNQLWLWRVTAFFWKGELVSFAISCRTRLSYKTKEKNRTQTSTCSRRWNSSFYRPITSCNMSWWFNWRENTETLGFPEGFPWRQTCGGQKWVERSTTCSRPDPCVVL